MFYVFGIIDKEINLGFSGWLGRYDIECDVYLVESCLFGNFNLFGCEYEFNLGVSYVISDDDFIVYFFDYVIIVVYGLMLVFLYVFDVIEEFDW